MYNVMSKKAEEFIDHEEIEECLAYAEDNKNNEACIDAILEKAKQMKGITHKEALVLLDCEIPEKNAQIYELAKKIKEEFYGDRYVCSVVFVKLLCQWLRILSLSFEKQTHPQKKTFPGRSTAGSDGTAGYGPQTPGN